MDKYLFALDLVQEAGDYIKNMMYGDLEITTKSSIHDFVTKVDRMTEDFIVTRIQKKYKNQDFITEEKTVKTLGLKDVWILDPIDGTMNFIEQHKNFAISLAYYEEDTPVFGIVYDVMNQRMISAIHNGGAFINGKLIDRLEESKSLSDLLLNVSAKTLYAYQDNPIPKFMGQRYIGSAALEICEVALGCSGAYISRRVNSWDIAAAIIILKETGGSWVHGNIRDGISQENTAQPIIAAINNEILEELMEWK